MEVDALGVVRAFNDKSHRFSQSGNQMLNIDVLLSYFLVMSLVHVCREANKAAHEMARCALGLDKEQILSWMIPPSIVSILNSE